MSFEDCLALKNSISVQTKIENGVKWRLLVTPKTDQFFYKYALVCRERKDNEAIGFACDGKFILRWISTDKGYISYQPFFIQSNN